MRFVVYDDQIFERRGGDLWTDRTFPLFIAAVGAELGAVTLLGRQREPDGSARFRLPAEVDFEPLPYYDSLADPVAAATGAVASVRAFWRSLSAADGAWILGPHPLGLLFAIVALVRRRRLVLGVRQEFRSYARSRHPRRRLLHLMADALEACWRLLAMVSAAVVVGPALGRQYRRSRRLHVLHVSMIRAAELAGPEVAAEKDYRGQLTVLSVGRLDEEKNPLLLADVLAQLRRDDPRWRLAVCGHGPAEGELRERLRELGAADAADLLGYVPIDDGLRDVYLGAHAFLHVSWTEGVPQVLFEAFAMRLPVVATDVGGVSSVAGEGAAILIPPGQVAPAVAALRAIASDSELRRRLTEAGAERAAAHTLEAEAAGTAAFLVG